MAKVWTITPGDVVLYQGVSSIVKQVDDSNDDEEYDGPRTIDVQLYDGAWVDLAEVELDRRYL